MRFLYVKLIGYIGLYNGIGLSELELHLDKCRNKVCVIAGGNGRGKSTIIQALSILPDGNNCFVPTMTAEKIIKLQDGDNIYDIHMIHPIDKNNNRGTTKITIKKNGEELNSNGNVTSYKDIIFTEFDMDANYLALSNISGDNRGLADKKPAERKKIMSSLIGSLEVYNNIYKNLNKKANIFKSYINTTAAKIQNIGDETGIRTALSGLKDRAERINKIIEDSKNKIIEAETIIKLNDPNGENQRIYDAIVSDIKAKEVEVDQMFQALTSNIDRFDITDSYDDIQKIIEKKNKELEKYNSGLIELNVKIETILASMLAIQGDIDKLNIKLDKIDVKGDDISQQIDHYKESIDNIEKSFDDFGIKNIDDVSKDEIDHTIEIIKTVVDSIDLLYQNSYSEIISDIENCYNTSTRDKLEKANKDIEEAKDRINDLKLQISNLSNDKEIVSVLDRRPKNCKDNSCPFVAKAIETKNKYKKSIEKEEQELYLKIQKEEKNIEECNKSISLLEEIDSTVSKLDAIIGLINSNKKLLSKFTITTEIIDKSRFLANIAKQYSFPELRSLYKYIEISNDIVEYKSYQKILHNLESEYVVYLNNQKQIEDIKSDINQKQEQYDSQRETYNQLLIEKKTQEEIIEALKTKIDQHILVKESYDNWDNARKELEDLKAKKDSLSSQFKSSLENMDKINEYNELIESSILELRPVEEEKKNLESQLTLLNSYNMEYAEYKEKYEFVDTLRKYSSPTSGSIQSLFMSIYMDKTLSMVNQLLGMMFGGEYRILQYVINEDEFRIPFIGNGLTVDDISNGSTSQVCIMGMIINLVLSDISSGKYNIVSLDEIDHGLDSTNQYIFIDIVNKIVEILDVGQLFMISHSVSSSMNNIDVILLSNDQEYIDLYSHANLVYLYEGK